MRLRPVTRPGVSSGPPAELLVGWLIEVWAGDGADVHDACRRFSAARLAWAESCGLSVGEASRWIAVSATPWSLKYLVNTGRIELADRMLAGAGVKRRDVEAVRERAQAWPDPGAAGRGPR